MSDDDTLTTVRDLKVAWRSGIYVAVGAAAVVGSLIVGAIWADRHDHRLEEVEKWIAKQEKKTEDEANRDRWRRRQTEVPQPLGPGVTR